MPPVIAIIVGFAVSFAASTVLTAIAMIGVSMALSAVLGALSPSPSGFDADAGTRGEASLDPDSAWIVCYGECEYAGDIIYAGKSGNDGEYLHGIYVMAGHEVEAIGTMKIGEETVPLDGSGDATGKYAGHVHVEKKLGTDAQTAFSIGISEWDSNCRARGRAVVWVRLKWNADLFPSGVGTLRLIRFLVKGKKVLDTRTATTAWSENAVLVMRDFCASADWGFKVPSADFNETVLNAEANICDESVSLKAGGTQKRYTVNGVFRADEDPREVLKAMLAACGGRPAFPAGKLAFYVAAWRGSAGTVTDDDLRQGAPLTVQPRRPRDVIANAVRGRYFGAETNWNAGEYVPFLLATTEEGQRIFTDLDFRFATDNARCMRLAKIHLMRLRKQERVTLHGKLPLYQYQPPDVIGVTRANLGWSGKTFEILDMGLSVAREDGGGPLPVVDITGDACDSSVFAWDHTTEEGTRDAAASATAAAANWVEASDQYVSASASGVFSYASGGPANNSMWIRWTWSEHTRYRNDESSFTVAASSAASAPAAPTLSQVAGGALGARTRYVRVAYVKEGVMFHISPESSLAVSANSLLKVTSPAAVAGYTGWVPLVGDTTNQERQQSGALPTAPVAFGADWTEPVGGANVSTGTKYSDDNAQLGGHVWDLPASATRYFYASYDYLNSKVEFTGGCLSARSPQQAARQNRHNHFRLSEGAMEASTPAAGGGGSGSGGGGGGACWAPGAPVLTQRGLVPIEQVRARRDYVACRSGRWRRVVRTLTHEYCGRLQVVPGVGRVTPAHTLAGPGGGWPRAEELFPEAVEYTGLVHNLETEVGAHDEHSYELVGENGASVVAHNQNPK